MDFLVQFPFLKEKVGYVRWVPCPQLRMEETASSYEG
jgi:hypothetical protein